MGRGFKTISPGPTHRGSSGGVVLDVYKQTTNARRESQEPRAHVLLLADYYFWFCMMPSRGMLHRSNIHRTHASHTHTSHTLITNASYTQPTLHTQHALITHLAHTLHKIINNQHKLSTPITNRSHTHHETLITNSAHPSHNHDTHDTLITLSSHTHTAH